MNSLERKTGHPFDRRLPPNELIRVVESGLKSVNIDIFEQKMTKTSTVFMIKEFE